MTAGPRLLRLWLDWWLVLCSVGCAVSQESRSTTNFRSAAGAAAKLLPQYGPEFGPKPALMPPTALLMAALLPGVVTMICPAPICPAAMTGWLPALAVADHGGEQGGVGAGW